MKTFILSFCFSLFIGTTFSQNIKTPKFSKENYKRKKRVFNTIGYSLLGTSAFFFVKGSVLAKKQRINSPNDTWNLDGIGETIVGAISGLASVPFFLIAAHYKNKLVFFSVNNNRTVMLQQNTLVHNTQPTISLKFNF
jgi:hypothetical protein